MTPQCCKAIWTLWKNEIIRWPETRERREGRNVLILLRTTRERRILYIQECYLIKFAIPPSACSGPLRVPVWVPWPCAGQTHIFSPIDPLQRSFDVIGTITSGTDQLVGPREPHNLEKTVHSVLTDQTHLLHFSVFGGFSGVNDFKFLIKFGQWYSDYLQLMCILKRGFPYLSRCDVFSKLLPKNHLCFVRIKYSKSPKVQESISYSISARSDKAICSFLRDEKATPFLKHIKLKTFHPQEISRHQVPSHAYMFQYGLRLLVPPYKWLASRFFYKQYDQVRATGV